MSDPARQSAAEYEIPAARFSLQVAAWSWGVPLTIGVLASLFGNMLLGWVVTLFLVPLVVAGFPLAGLIGIYYGWKGTRTESRKSALFGIALNTGTVLVGIAVAAWAIPWARA